MHQAARAEEGFARDAFRHLAIRLGGSRRLSFVEDASRSMLALFEAVAVAVHLEDVDVVGEPVEERAGQALGTSSSGG